MNSKNIKLHGVSIPVESLHANMLVTGTTGSGKTTLLKSLMKELLSRQASNRNAKDASVIFDVKGDLLPSITEILRSCGRSSDLIVIGEGKSVSFNPLTGLNPTQIANLLISISAMNGQDLSQRSSPDDMFWSTSRFEVLAAVCEVAAMTAKAVGRYDLSLTHIQRLSRMLHQSLPQVLAWVADVKPLLSESAATALESLAALPDNTRSCIATSASGVLGAFTRSPIKELVNPSSYSPAINLPELLFGEGKVIVVHAENSAELLPAMILFKSALFSSVLARRRRPEWNQKRYLWILLDEFTRTFIPHEAAGVAAEHITLEMSRAAGTGFILAAQNLSALESLSNEVLVQKLAALCRTLCFYQNTCPTTARLAHTVFGTRQIFRKHRTQGPSLPPPLLIPRDEELETSQGNIVLVPALEPVVPPDRLARLRTGEAVIKLGDGSTHTIRPLPLAS